MIEVIRCIQLGDPQIIKHHDTVGKSECLLLVMRDIDHGDLQLLLDLLELLAQNHFNLRIQGGHRLIEKDDIRIKDKGTGDSHSLLLTTGKLLRLLKDVLLQPYGLDNLPNLLVDLILAHLLAVLALLTLKSVADIMIDIHVREQRIALENDADVPVLRSHVRDIHAVLDDLPAARLLDTNQHAQDGRFATARRAQEGEKLAPHHLKGYILQDGLALKLFIDVFTGYDYVVH